MPPYLHVIHLSAPLYSGPINQGLWGSAMSCPSGTWGEAQAEIKFDAFSRQIWHLPKTIFVYLKFLQTSDNLS